jgi:hypothetical protein
MPAIILRASLIFLPLQIILNEKMTGREAGKNYDYRCLFIYAYFHLRIFPFTHLSIYKIYVFNCTYARFTYCFPYFT